MEMTVDPEPKWALEFQEYLINELNIKKTDSIFAIGKLHSLMRKYKENVDEDYLNTLADNFADNVIGELYCCQASDYDNKLPNDLSSVAFGVKRGYKAGYKKRNLIN